jgi:hypothetical protein
MGATATLNVSVHVPANGIFFLALHMDYGLKGTTPYAPGGSLSLDALKPSTTTVLIPNLQTYTFAYTVPGASGNTIVQSCNAFKKSPGTASEVVNTFSLNPVPGSNVVLKDAKGTALGSCLTT